MPLRGHLTSSFFGEAKRSRLQQPTGGNGGGNGGWRNDERFRTQSQGRQLSSALSSRGSPRDLPPQDEPRLPYVSLRPTPPSTERRGSGVGFKRLTQAEESPNGLDAPQGADEYNGWLPGDR